MAASRTTITAASASAPPAAPPTAFASPPPASASPASASPALASKAGPPVGAAAGVPLGGRMASSALYQQVAERLRSSILAHTLGPGSWIDEQAIAAEYGISRTPLREALKVLAAEGLVTMKLRRGAYVTEVSERDLAEVYHLLALLESDAAVVVSQTATPAQIQELEALHAELEAHIADRDRFFAANERFHHRLLEIADNRWRNQLVNDLRKVMKLNRLHSLFKQGRLEASLEEHRHIMAGIKARDADRVQRAMTLHFANGKQAASID